MSGQIESDEQVVIRVQRGNTDAFGVIIDRYQPKLLRYGTRFLSRSEDIEDMVQEVFLKAYTNIQSYNSALPFSPWIYRIAHNTFVNELKRQSRRPWSIFESDTLFPTLAAEESTDRAALERELHEEIESSLAQLKETYREPLVLFYYESLSYAEIADVLRIPVTTVGVRISRAKEQLRAIHNQPPV